MCTVLSRAINQSFKRSYCANVSRAVLFVYSLDELILWGIQSSFFCFDIRLLTFWLFVHSFLKQLSWAYKLLVKLGHYVITGPCHDLIKSYLMKGTQFTYCQNTHSDQCHIEYGIPQGSVLGPLLFLVYIRSLQMLAIMDTLHSLQPTYL